MEPGSIVEFFEEKRILCGVVLELKGERLRVLAQNSREFTLPPKRLHKFPRVRPRTQKAPKTRPKAGSGIGEGVASTRAVAGRPEVRLAGRMGSALSRSFPQL